MTDRRERIKDLFHRAVERTVADRARFLAEACDGDLSMFEEVESLILAHEADDNFLEVPAYELAAESFAAEIQELTPGQQLGPYTILSSLGFGGMGEVYLARDVRLDRKVALKLLAWEFARDEKRVLRFEQEARAASALNHPNVCVIHEIGKSEDGRRFMAMEFIDGITLRVRMAHKKLTLKEVLDVGAQVAWALEAAHSAGIVHRDIKPENIMLRRDGYVKVLDFGIAKLNANPPRLRDTHEAEAVEHLHTAPGTLMGTAKYMSPEQLREQPVDQRSDIWSLGVVLHEMVTGFTPFEAGTTNDTIAVILEKHPPRLGFHTGGVPEEFQQLVKKALSKKRSERYQTISQLGSDLSKLRRLVGVDVPTEQLEQLTLNLESTGNQQGVGTGRAVSTIFSMVRSQAIKTADYVLSEIKQHKTAAVFTGLTSAFLLLFIGLGSPGLFSRRQPSVSTTRTMTMTPLTNSGRSVCAAVSPDGKYVAHAEEEGGTQKLLLTGIVTSGTSVLVPPGDFAYRGLTFSRDGNYLYFTRSEKGESGVLYELALPGSAPRRIKDGVDSPITVSPNGDRFAFVRLNKSSNEFSLLAAALDGTEEQTLVLRGNGKRLSVSGPAWSPNGKTIVCAAGWWDNGYHMNLIEADLEDRRERVISQVSWYSVLQVAWLQDHTGLVISAKEHALSPYQLWRVSYPHGEAVRITNDTTEYKSVSLTLEGDTIVPIQTHQIAQIWIGSEGEGQRARAIASTVGRNYGLDWTSKGKIVFSSMAGNNLNISLIDPDGSNQTQLTANAGDNYLPATSHDGRYIVFASNRSGSLNIWRMNAEDGSEAKQLTFGDGNSYPTCSADNQWVTYDNLSSKTTLWKVSIDGGEPVQLTDAYARMPVVSPNNQFIACRYLLEVGSEGIAILPFQGGPPLRRLPIPIMDWQRVQWTPDGRALTYIDAAGGVSNVWSYDLDSGSRKQLTDFTTDKIFAYAWTLNHKQFASVRGSEIRDVTIISNWR